jgi:hypothetical protein
MNFFKRIFLIPLILTVFIGCNKYASPLKDGKYFGYESLPNLSLREGPESIRYYTCILQISNGKVTLNQSPTQLVKGKVYASASDGGFPKYDGEITVLGKRTLVSLRKTSCDYCERSDDPLPSKIEREYVIRFIGDGSFELNGVIYSTKPDPKLEWKQQ